jgi:PIN domain nuclease of toxin-antitoxin system
LSYLLDTHAFLWAVFAPEKLGRKARSVVADGGVSVFLSPVSLWEVSLKFALGKLTLEGCAPEDLVVAAREMGLGILDFGPEEAASFHRLPRMAHKDPFDRMLVWQAIRCGLTLISKDGALPEYRALGLKTLW